MADPAKKRLRLTPTERKKVILDHAAMIVGNEGALAASMARVAEAAGVSTPLVYSYFPNRIELLKELLAREYRRMRRDQIQLTKLADDFEDFVRRTTRAYLQHCSDRGPFIQNLLDEPALQTEVAQVEERDAVVQFLAQQVRKRVKDDLEDKDILRITEVGLGLSRAAGIAAVRADSIDELAELTTTMIVASIDASSALLMKWKSREREASQTDE